MRKTTKWAWLAVAALLTTGCFGSFSLTQRMHHWNGTVTGNKWGNEFIFVVTSPAYIITTLSDTLVLNSVEFWTGENWVSAPGM
jgi:hypothetical protein